VAVYVEHYNHVRLHSALGYVTPADKLAGHEKEIFATRDHKLEEARERRKARRAAERIGSIDFAALRRQVTIEQVLRHLGHLDSLRGSGPQRRGPCPVHGSSRPGSRSFSVNFQKNVFRCFCPDCGAHGNVLNLWAAVHHLPLGEAARHLAQTFGLDLQSGIREEATVHVGFLGRRIRPDSAGSPSGMIRHSRHTPRRGAAVSGTLD
jgi:DNA primase